MADEFAGLFEFDLQAGDFGVGVMHAGAQLFQFTARAPGGFLHRAGFAHDFGNDVGELGDVLGGGNTLGALFDLVVVLAGGFREVAQAIDEAGEHVLEAGLGIVEFDLDGALPLDNVA